MDKEKQDWLEQIRATELKRPFRYFAPGPNGNVMYYSQEYLNETPLEQLRANFDKWSNRSGGHGADV